MADIKDIAQHIFPATAVDWISYTSLHTANQAKDNDLLRDYIFTDDGKWLRNSCIAIYTDDGCLICSVNDYKKFFNASYYSMRFHASIEVGLKNEFLLDRNINIGDHVLIANRWFILSDKNRAIMNDIEDQIHLHDLMTYDKYSNSNLNKNTFFDHSNFITFCYFDKFNPNDTVHGMCNNKQEVEKYMSNIVDDAHKIITNNITGQQIIIDKNNYDIN